MKLFSTIPDIPLLVFLPMYLFCVFYFNNSQVIIVTSMVVMILGMAWLSNTIRKYNTEKETSQYLKESNKNRADSH